MACQRQVAQRNAGAVRHFFTVIAACCIVSVAHAQMEVGDCVDDPIDWVEKFSLADCKFYADREWCTPTGDYGRSALA